VNLQEVWNKVLTTGFVKKEERRRKRFSLGKGLGEEKQGMVIKKGDVFKKAAPC